MQLLLSTTTAAVSSVICSLQSLQVTDCYNAVLYSV